MSEEKVATFTIPALPSILNGMADVFQRLDAEIASCITGLEGDIAKAYEKGRDLGRTTGKREAVKEIIAGDEDDSCWIAVSRIISEDICILTDLMTVSSWESVETPSGGHGDSIEYTKGKIPASYDFDEEWARVAFDNIDEDTIIKINTYFEEKGE